MIEAFLHRARAVPLVGVIFGYLLVCGGLLPSFLHRVGPDASCYLGIARKYAAGDVRHAINGYWSPLLSWLLAPLLWFGGAAEVTARCLQVAIGAGALVAVWWLGGRVRLGVADRVRTTACLIPAVALYALSDTTPDLLVACLLVLYVGVVVGRDYPASSWQGAACGVLGSLAYLAKAYAFPFFLLHFVAVSALLAFQRRSDWNAVRRIAAATVAGALVFGVIAGGWAGVISRKYARLTIGTTGSFNLGLGGRVNPTESKGLFPPPNDTALSAWEDPSELRAALRSPANGQRGDAARRGTSTHRGVGVARPGSLSQRGLLLVRTALDYAATLFRLSPVWPLILLGVVLSLGMPPRGAPCDPMWILLATLVIYPTGYLLIFIQARFFWVITFLLSISAGLVGASLPGLQRRPWRGLWSVVTTVSFMLWPTWVLFQLRDDGSEETSLLAARLAGMLPPGTRIASDRDWGITNGIAFHLDARYHGMLAAEAAAVQDQRLREQGIRHLLIWDDPARLSCLESWREVSIDPIPQLGHLRVPRLYVRPP